MAGAALGDPDVIPLWFGESDLVTPAFIRDAAKRALDEGKTFYTNARGITPLREAIRDFHRRTADADVALERITVPGAAMLAVVCALQCVVETGDNIVVVSPVCAGSDGNAVPTLLSSDLHVGKAGLRQDLGGKLPVLAFDLLQAEHVRRPFGAEAGDLVDP